MRQACAYATVALGSVGAYAKVGAYASFKKLASGIVVILYAISKATTLYPGGIRSQTHSSASRNDTTQRYK
jgi:hypothetical protein